MEGEISVSRTDGGIPVVLERSPSSGSVALAVYVRVGSRDEPKERAGIAHLLEHTVFRGTRSFDSRQISERIEDAGGELNGYTTKEFTCYHSSILRETVGVAAEVLAEVVACPTLTQEGFDLEKQIVTQEVSMLLNEPDTYIQYLFAKALWEGHPMSVPEAGDFKTIGDISAQDLRGFYRDHYSPANLIVVASGDLDTEWALDWASSFHRMDDAHERPPQSPPSPRAQVRVFPREGEQAYVGMGFPGVSARDEGRQAQRMLSALLGAGMSSRLFQRVREELGLVYSIFTTSKHFTDCGNLTTYFSCSTGKLSWVLDAVSKELSRLKTEGLDPGELDRSKRLIKGATIRRLESTEDRMFRIGDAYAMTGEVKPLHQVFREIEEVTEEEVMSMAHRTLRPDRLCVAIHGPGQTGIDHSLDF